MGLARPTKRRPNLCDSFVRKIPLSAGKIAAQKGRWLNASAWKDKTSGSNRGRRPETAICILVREALYNLDHPLEYVPKSIEVQRACMKEREFYVAFLERLEKL